MRSEEIINKMLDIISPVIDQSRSRNLNFPIEFTFFHTLERIQCNLQTLDLLIQTDILKYDHGIGLTCRNLLSDFITTGYIVKLSKDTEEHYINLYRLYYTDLKKADSFLDLYVKAGIATQEDYKKYTYKKNDPKGIYKIIFDYKAEFEINKFPTTSDIIKLFIESKQNDLWAKEIIHSYDIWTFYSKYEHIGWSSYEMTRDTDKDKSIERIKSVLKNTSILLSSCLEILNEKESYTLSSSLLTSIYTA